MKILGITDVHGKTSKVMKLVEVIDDVSPSIVMIAGDITNFGNSDRAKKVLEPLTTLEVPIVAVFGNCDGRDVPGILEEMGILAHGRRVEVNGLGIVGIGGSNVTPFGTIWELTEDEIGSILEKNYLPGNVILSHAPPYGTRADRTHSGVHVGSRALRMFIEEKQPPFVLTGHIHEARSVDRIGRTLIINPGPLFRGYYAVIKIEKDRVEAKLEKL
ncbi:metallophosphoesterase [Thermococcus profundus]|uniref:Metallophosphoesterase n=1 Tax=Thermococcus profundus TaxID=49899 RepID=A0A2Z2MLI0_THEPR|nr:metallophosphoesterase [Thermococcus profundus]ASJ02808.1 metallophosphoesterase [Thermococcus profundus]